MVYKVDCHCHPLSHIHYPMPAWNAMLDASDKQRIVDMLHSAVERGLDAVAITDHNQFTSGFYAQKMAKKLGLKLKVIPGSECSVILEDGTEIHVLALGCKESFEFDENSPLDILIDLIHDAGGVAVLSHPHYYPHAVPIVQEYMDGMEEYNGVAASSRMYSRVYTPTDFKGFLTQGSDYHLSEHRDIAPSQRAAITLVDETYQKLYNIINES